MTTFLQLCKDAARESSTVSGDPLTTVTGLTDDRLSKFVYWVRRAWLDIQNESTSWRWMRKEYDDKALTIGQSRYTATALGISDLDDWIVGPNIVYLYDSTIGVSDESPLEYVRDWDLFKHKWLRGSPDNNRPTQYAISPTEEICFGAPPDKAYLISGEYRKSAQILTNNADEPECPSRFHGAISDYANILMAQHDEAEMHVATNYTRFNDTMRKMRRDQLPPFEIGAGPLA